MPSSGTRNHPFPGPGLGLAWGLAVAMALCVNSFAPAGRRSPKIPGWSGSLKAPADGLCGSSVSLVILLIARFFVQFLLSLSPSDSKAIVDGNLKLILGLIWTLILHYSISMPVWEGEDEEAESKTPKQRLLGWIQNKVPDMPINNFSQDWRDGKALGALVDSCAPDKRPKL
ncbi:unnamed protein product [Menidia menidia]|uniref:(Atlantic silverside) hypothetical protein n=1 Tax=Menidia menidia TaxID=238744 RepID=A0A8S4BEV8_9TELE|nr:unnamed protein product [Menidia menidia]